MTQLFSGAVAAGGGGGSWVATAVGGGGGGDMAKGDVTCCFLLPGPPLL